MNEQDIRLLLGFIRADIKELKADINVVLKRHEIEIDELKAFKFKVVGMSALVVVMAEVAWKLIENAIK